MTGGVSLSYDMFGSTIEYYGIHREETSGRCDSGFRQAYAVLQELQGRTGDLLYVDCWDASG